MERQTIKIDATDQVLGRLATQIVTFLRGKNKPGFRPNVDGGEIVIIENASKIKVTGNKMDKKEYFRYSGYPSGRKSRKMNELSMTQLLTKAVYNMLPKNKLRNSMMKRLTINE
ncbi:MAG: 50S ribosomal protein L13 [Patescibacteria group bacterium]|nr:50S ribosomal protein L13 [Patescibacteria group bacterium]